MKNILAILLVLIIFLSACGEDDSVAEEVNVDELSETEFIEYKVREIVAEFRRTSITNIRVNDHMGTDDNDYLVLVDLTFEARNNASTAKDMLEMYNNELGAKMAEVDGVTELTIFWQVPHLVEGQNIAKANLIREGNDMYFEEHWFDPSIFN